MQLIIYQQHIIANFISLIIAVFVMQTLVSCDAITDEDTVENQTITTVGSNYTVADVMLGNTVDHDDVQDYSWDSSEITNIVLNVDSITVNTSGAIVDGSKVTIISAGTYNISGSLTDGQIIVNTTDAEIVRLILNGVNIYNSTNSPIFIANSAKTIIVLADNSQNFVTDGQTYVFENVVDDEPNAAIFSKDDLTIFGNGSLTVNGNYNDGIASKDGLIITSGNISIKAVDDGMRGKNYLVVNSGNLNIQAGGDGFKSDNDEDAAKGYILIKDGLINVTAAGDAMAAETDLLISGGGITLKSGGGSNTSVFDEESAKGLKGVVCIVVDNGIISINSADDAVHSNGSISINGGSLTISSADDGIHSDAALGINGGKINITKSYEGIESRTVIIINDGEIHLISSDDGINVAGGIDASGIDEGDPNFETPGDYYLYINGGYIAINATGDGIDSNGSIEMTGGEVIVNGPTSNGNGALDHSSFNITGGYLVAVGSSGMAQAPSSTSSQYSISVKFGTTQLAGNIVHIQDSNGIDILTFAPLKKYQSVVFSSTGLTNGASYDLYLGGSATGTVNDGLYIDGVYTPGTKYKTFTISNIITNVF